MYVSEKEIQKGAKVAGSNYKNQTGTRKEAEIITKMVRTKENATDERRNARSGRGSFNQAAKHFYRAQNLKLELKAYRQNNS